MDIAPRMPGFHESQERQEARNVAASAVGHEIGVATHDWGDGMWSVRTPGLPGHGPGNQLTGWGPATEGRLDAIVPWFDAAGCSMRVRVPAAEVDGGLGRRLFDRGFALEGVEAWMAAPLAELAFDPVQHDVRTVSTPGDAGAFGRAFLEGWGIGDALVQRVVLAAMAPFPGPSNWHRHVAWVDGEPAGESLMAVYGECAYLAEAATVPAYRRRGIQRDLIAARAALARELGASVLFSAVQYGDRSWSNMRAMGLREVFVTVTLRRPAGAGVPPVSGGAGGR